MRHELYIDNQRVDLSPSTKFNLTYKSNLLSELDKIVSSYSYTIKLPKTERNLKLIECSHIISNGSPFPYLQHRARLLRDGIEIVRNAIVVLLKVDKDIQISLSWGNVSVLADFVKNKRKLSDLNLPVIEWKVGAWGGNLPDGNYVYGKNSSKYGGVVQPVIYHSAIFDAIKTDSGLNITHPNEEYWDKLAIINPKQVMGGTVDNSPKKTGIISGIYSDIKSQIEYEVTGVVDYTTIKFVEGISKIKGFILKDFNYSALIKGYITIKTKLYPGAIKEEMRIQDSKGQYKIEPTSITTEDDYYVYRFDLNHEMSAKLYNTEPCVLQTIIEEDKNPPYTEVIYSGQIEVSVLYTTLYNILPKAGIPLPYYIPKHMPDMTQIEYLKAIMNMFGYYAEPLGNDGIRLLSYQKIEENKSKATDWSSKMINRNIESDAVEFRMSGMAQNLIYQYAEDEDGNQEYSSLVVDDKTLDLEKVALTLPFVRVLENNGKASIPLYNIGTDDEVVGFDDIEITLDKPRIGIVTDTMGEKYVGNVIKMQFLLERYWSAYQKYILRPKIITEKVRLNPINLKELDMTIPVYIEQYGSYFAILEIKTGDDDICTVKLLKI